MNRQRVRVAALLAGLLPLGDGSGAEGSTAAAGLEALDYAFRFATAIESDAKDRGRAQAAVAVDLATIGAVDAAVALADRIAGWHRGTAYADIAAACARLGRGGTARELLARAEEVRAGVEGWYGPRIRAHVAQALALLGDLEQSERIAQDLAAGDRQYVGRSVASIAAGRAARGDFDAAMAALRGLDENVDFDVSWWRTVGYATVARETRLPPEQRARAIEAAHRSASGISGWKRAEALESVAEVQRELGKPRSALASLRAAQAIVVAQPDSLPVKAPLLSNLSRAFARLGAAGRARRLLAAAEQVVPLALVVDRPGVYANLASSYLVLEDEPQAWRAYDTAVRAAEDLVNARPRALAVVSICRSMGRSGVELKPDTRRRLDSLFDGLGDPW